MPEAGREAQAQMTPTEAVTEETPEYDTIVQATGWEALEPTALFAVTESKARPGHYVEVCVDSGCGKSTTGPALAEMLGYEVAETPQSRQGYYFIGPGGEHYANLGSVNFNAQDEKFKELHNKI